jgi:hypothetical protein
MARDVVGTEDYTGGPVEIPTNEIGNDVFDILEEFMERLATHQHQGVDSKSISLNIEKDQQTFVRGVDFTWASLGDGNYEAALPVAAGSTFDGNLREYYFIDADGYPKRYYPTIVKVDNSNYKVLSNDNDINIKVITL